MQAKVRLVEALLALDDHRRADEELASALESDPSFRRTELFESLRSRIKTVA